MLEKRKIHVIVLALLAFPLGAAGCGQTAAENKAEHEFDRNLHYEVAEQVIEEEGFSHAAAEEAREAGEANGLSPAETAEMGAVAKNLGH